MLPKVRAEYERVGQLVSPASSVQAEHSFSELRRLKTWLRTSLCQKCDGWFHAGCQDVTGDDYKALNKLAMAVHWYCKTCNKSVQKVMGSVGRLQNRMEKSKYGSTPLHSVILTSVTCRPDSVV